MGLNFVFLFILPVAFSSDIFSKDHLKIVGGEATNILRYPSMVSIRFGPKRQHICGGSILTHFWILSVAHCICPDQLKRCLHSGEVLVVAGSTYCDQDVHDTSVKYLKIESSFHPGYEIGKNQHDISLLKLKESLMFTDKVVPANMLPGGFFYGVDPWNVYSKCIAVGWGSLNEQFHNSSVILQHVDLPLISLHNCETMWDTPLFETDLCTLDNTGKDACTGDSGGPLFCGEYVVAVCSRSYGCRGHNESNVWTRVDKYGEWISVTVRENSQEIFGDLLKFKRSLTGSSRAMKILTLVLVCILIPK